MAKERIIDFKGLDEKDKKKVLKMIEHKGFVETEVLDKRHLKSKERIEELEPLFKEYAKDIRFSVGKIREAAKESGFEDPFAPLEEYVKEEVGRSEAKKGLDKLKASEQPFKLIVARYKGEPIGFSYYMISPSRNVPLLMATFVKKEHRGKGLASKLTLKKLYQARTSGYKHFIPGLVVSPGGKRINEETPRQWSIVENAPNEFFERLKKKTKRGYRK